MHVLDTVFSLLAPHVCVVCQKEGSLLCVWCEPDAFEPIPSRCYRCKRLTPDFATCPSCRRRSPLRHVWVKAQYVGSAKQLLHALKFERARAGALVIAAAMAEVLPYLPPDTLVIPVPTATSRVRQRGYDQAVLLAQAICDQAGFALIGAVTRVSQSRQVGASRKQRLSQLDGAFFVTNPQLVQGASILLVDDVITTAATLETMTRVLKQAGAKSVSALVFAQKQ